MNEKYVIQAAEALAIGYPHKFSEDDWEEVKAYAATALAPVLSDIERTLAEVLHKW